VLARGRGGTWLHHGGAAYRSGRIPRVPALGEADRQRRDRDRLEPPRGRRRARGVRETRATELSQLFQNLLSNAIKYRSEATPEIHIRCARQESDWLFSFADNGIGIASAFHERVFGVFKRLHTREKYPGTGIGLAICRRVVERFGGRIWVESAEGTGSTFHFTLPHAQAANDKEASSKGEVAHVA